MRKITAGLITSAIAATALTAATAAPAAANGVCTMKPNMKVTEMTIDELNQYELLNGESIPTFAEFLDYANSVKVGVVPEIKYFDPNKPAKPVSGTALAQLNEYTAMVTARTDIPGVLIGSFDEPILNYFKDITSSATAKTWPRIWFRGAPPLSPPTVAEMKSSAPSATALGVINIGYVQGKFPLDGKTYNVPKEFADAKIPVNIWYNTLTGGDNPSGGPGLFGVASPGWSPISTLAPQNVKWITTDYTGLYSLWGALTPVRPVPEMIAHRGGGVDSYSENSMMAFKQAVKDGAKYLETDVQWTKPKTGDQIGTPVLMHDETINRTTRCKPTSAAFTPITPQRVLDTRTQGGALNKDKTATVDLASLVPAGTTAIAYNLTATGQTTSGFASVGPAGTTNTSSVINWMGPSQTIANGYVSMVSADRKVTVSVGGNGSAQVILDVMGYFAPPPPPAAAQAAGVTPTGLYTSITPTRIYDSKEQGGPISNGQSRTININTALGQPVTNAMAASINVTITGTTGSGVLTASKNASSATSTINWSGAGQTIANAVISEVAPDGTFTITASGSGTTQFKVDLMGYFTPTDDTPDGAFFFAVPPVRAYDSRVSNYDSTVPPAPLTSAAPRTNVMPTPTSPGVVAVAVNTTITGTQASGYLSLEPGNAQSAGVSTVNWTAPSTTRANGIVGAADFDLNKSAVLTKAFVGGSGSTHYLLDVGGYFQKLG